MKCKPRNSINFICFYVCFVVVFRAILCKYVRCECVQCCVFESKYHQNTFADIYIKHCGALWFIHVWKCGTIFYSVYRWCLNEELKKFNVQKRTYCCLSDKNKYTLYFLHMWRWCVALFELKSTFSKPIARITNGIILVQHQYPYVLSIDREKK